MLPALAGVICLIGGSGRAMSGRRHFHLDFTAAHAAGVGLAMVVLAAPAAGGQWEKLEPIDRGMIPSWSAPASVSHASSLTAAPPLHLGGLSIVIVPGPPLAGNAPALAAFNRAANQWASHFTDPITVTINADLAPLGGSVIGDSQAVTLQGTYDEVRTQ